MRDSNPKIFISYSREHDRESARAIYSQLSANGYSPWIDEENILPGQIWDDEVELAISHSEVFLVLISSGMVKSKSYAHDEWHMALEMQKNLTDRQLLVIPIRLDDCKVPFLLRRFQWVNWFEDIGKERLLKRIAQILNTDAIKNTTPFKAEEIEQTNWLRSKLNAWQYSPFLYHSSVPYLVYAC